MKQPKGNSSSKKRHQSILLQLKIENWSVTFAGWANSHPLFCIFNCYVEARSLSPHSHRSYAYSPRQQSFSDCKESLSNTPNLRIEISIFINICIPVHHIDSWNAHIIKLYRSIINAIISHFHSHICNCYSRQFLQILVPYWNQKGPNTLILAFDNSLSEDKSVISVSKTICNPVFLAQNCR